MKGKLVKRSNGRFDLYSIEDKNQINTIASSFDNPKGKLSLKNCEAIELGYDLDELAKVFHEQHKFASSHIADITSFKLGFQKALELMGDKKFSKEQLREAFFHVQNEPTFDVFKQSLQQTEWDVEIETVPALSNNGNVYYGDIPKLDENNCLILKKI